MSHGYPEPGLLLFPSPSPDSPTHTHTAGRIDKQLDTMEVHKRHVEELWKNALNLAEQLKQVRQHTIHLALFSVLLWPVPYSLPSLLLPRRFRCPQWSHSRVWYQ